MKVATLFAFFFTTNLFLVNSASAIVDTKNANYGDSFEDLNVPGTGYALKVVRSYNSRSLFSGIFGFGWCSDPETRLEITPENNIKTTECGGGLEITYSPKDVNPHDTKATIGIIMSEVRNRNKNLQPKYFTDLEKELQENTFLREEFVRQLKLKGKANTGVVYRANGRQTENIVLKDREYIRTLSDGSYQKYDLDGRMTYMYDRNGNFQKMEWKNGQLVSIVDNSGRQLTFKYDPLSKKVVQISGPRGLVVTYSYAGEDLKKVVNAWKRVFTYEYDDTHNMTKVTFPDKTSKILTYNKDKDWVTSLTDRKGCIEQYDYQTDPQDPKNHYTSSVVKTCGKTVTNKSSYEFFYRQRKDGVARYLSRVRSDVNGEVTDISYHEVFGKPVSILRGPNLVEYTYYDNGLTHTKREKFRTMTFLYNDPCQKVSSVESQFFVEKKKEPVKTLKTEFEYDGKKCNLVTAKSTDGMKVHLQYDSRGRIAVIEDQSKKVVKIKYEERFGKPAVVSRPGMGSVSLSYKNDGSIDKVSNKEGDSKVASQVLSIFNSMLELIAPASAETSI